MLEIANERQATTISITNHENSPVANKSKYHINTATREKLFLDEFSFSRVSAMVIIETLYLLLTRDKKMHIVGLASMNNLLLMIRFRN